MIVSLSDGRVIACCARRSVALRWLAQQQAKTSEQRECCDHGDLKHRTADANEVAACLDHQD
jgi:hypothetical protein